MLWLRMKTKGGCRRAGQPDGMALALQVGRLNLRIDAVGWIVVLRLLIEEAQFTAQNASRKGYSYGGPHATAVHFIEQRRCPSEGIKATQL